jgi:ferredoxin-NADP reductase
MRAVVTSVVPDGGYTRHTLSCEGCLTTTRPGQYVQLNDRRRSYMVIASQSGVDVEVITPADTQMSTFLDIGSNVELTDPLGGFDMTDIDAHGRVTCIAAGSGITAMLPLITLFVNRRRDFTLLYLESRRQHLKLDSIPVPLWAPGIVKYVNTSGTLRIDTSINIVDAFRQLGLDHDFDDTLTFACGSREFIERLRSGIVPRYINASMFRTNVGGGR